MFTVLRVLKDSRKTQQNLWRSVESRLDICVHSLTFIASRAKVDDFDYRTFQAANKSVQTHLADLVTSVLFEKDVLRFEIAVYKPRLAQQTQAVKQLLRKDPHEGSAQASELILLYQFVEIDREQFKHKTQMLPVNEGILEPQNVVVVVLVHTAIELQMVSQRIDLDIFFCG